MKTKNFLTLIASIILAQLAGLVGAIFTSPNIDGWYAGLLKPELAPPNWIFGPVWTTLFVLMGTAAYLVWSNSEKKKLRARTIALWVYLAQLIINILWSVAFFGFQSPLLGVIVIAVLWLLIAATIYTFARVSKTAAWLLVPYILWVSFASYLNVMIWWIN